MSDRTETKTEAKKRRKWLLITLAINFMIVAYIAIKEFGGTSGSVSVRLGEIKPVFILSGAACFFVAACMEYIKFRQLLMVSEGKFDRRGALECAMLGRYYDNVTPLGAGGQPFQMRYLLKRGYTSGTSVAAPTMSFISQHFGFVLIAIAVFAFGSAEADEAAGVLRIGAYIGISFYALLPLTIVTFMIIPKPLRAFIHWLVRLLSKIRFGKYRLIEDADATSEKWLANLDQSVQCLRVYSKRPLVVVKMLVESVIYQAAVLSIQFCMLHAFGGSEDWWTIITVAVYINASITIVPTPGNAGAAEGSFYAVFSELNGGRLFWAMTGWRIAVYYSWLVCGFIKLIRSAAEQKKRPHIRKLPGERLRVMLFTDSFYPSKSGVVGVVDAYARNINAAGEYACVVCPEPRAVTAPVPYDTFCTRTIPVPGRKGRLPVGRATKQIKQLFKTDPPDIIHSHSPFLNGKLALKLGKKYDIPVVATFHSNFCADMLGRTHSHLLANILKHLLVSYFVRAEYVWASSSEKARALREYGYNGDICVMENGVSEPEGEAKSWGLQIQNVLKAYRTHSTEGYSEKIPCIFDM